MKREIERAKLFDYKFSNQGNSIKKLQEAGEDYRSDAINVKFSFIYPISDNLYKI